ncbi:MAG TPA: hypothetical protein VHZ78_04395 [Rhizomicrobium sp.]|nr:hypothetical protein [Rhizomicrobium sp.]
MSLTFVAIFAAIYGVAAWIFGGALPRTSPVWGLFIFVMPIVLVSGLAHDLRHVSFARSAPFALAGVAIGLLIVTLGMNLTMAPRQFRGSAGDFEVWAGASAGWFVLFLAVRRAAKREDDERTDSS